MKIVQLLYPQNRLSEEINAEQLNYPAGYHAFGIYAPIWIFFESELPHITLTGLLKFSDHAYA